MSGQLYKIANQPVTPQMPPFFHACHTLMHTHPSFTHHLTCNFSPLPHAPSHNSHMLSCLPHTVSCAGHMTPNNCHIPVASCHEMATQALQLCQVAMILLQPCMCA